jgi:aspartokinase-like uncharacterized kinase
MTAFALESIVPILRVVDRSEDARTLWLSGRVPILAPRRFLDEDDRLSADPLEHSWSVTSDSIAARVAVRLGAVELALLKSAELPPGTDRERAAELGLVDPAFPRVSNVLGRVTFENFRDSGGRSYLLPRRLDAGARVG